MQDWWITCYSPSMEKKSCDRASVHFVHEPTETQHDKYVGPQQLKKFTADQIRSFKFACIMKETENVDRMIMVKISYGAKDSVFCLSSKGDIVDCF